MLIAAVVSPGGSSRANARLERDGAIIAGAAGDVAPDDPVAALHRIAENIGALAGDLFDEAAGLVAGDNRQCVAVAERAMPAVHVGAAESRSRDLDQQRARIQLRNRHRLYGQRFVMFGYNGGATGFHDFYLILSWQLTDGTTGTCGTTGTVPIVPSVPIVSHQSGNL